MVVCRRASPRALGRTSTCPVQTSTVELSRKFLMRAARQVDDDAERDAERDAVDREAGRRVCFEARLFSLSRL